ncbi:MAG TPA: NAD(P)-dependent oxidoreductase [Mycobacteriales bacterium]|nr:NAD(P)-dependent oxidoreductase [Mycobacteriales bacterium]
MSDAGPWRVLALPPLPHDVLVSLFADERIELVTPAQRTPEHVAELMPTADIVIGDWSPSLRLDDPGPRVCFVQQPSVGVDGIDTEAFAAAGVPVANCHGANTVSVAEWCLSATLALLRHTVEADAAVRRGEWPQTSVGGRELSGRRVGVVGMGPIGRAVAERFTALGCVVSYWSRTPKPEAPAPWLELDELLASSEIVILVVALAAQTRGLLDARRLALLPQGGLLLNGARAEVVDEAALLAALDSGHLGGVALDVFSTEPLAADSPLRAAPRVLLSPHVAGATGEAAMRIVGQSSANLRRALDGEPVIDVVNGVDPLVRRR